MFLFSSKKSPPIQGKVVPEVLPKTAENNDWNDIDIPTYDWSVRIFRSVKRLLKVNMEMHADQQLQDGDIFLFNHFSRFETFIPQYLIYEKTGAYCCSIASAEFFTEETVLSNFLDKVGVYPHDHERLFPILAQQILRGRKVIIFPEGGLVKDHQVMDKKGRYSIYSRMRGKRRKQHTGAAVLAQGLEAFKATIRNAYSRKDIDQLMRWKKQLQLDNLDQLLLAALKPTLIVPSNITFYPIRSSDNVLRKSVELFADGLSPRATEELLVEGNIMLKDTDMDIRMGRPVDPYHVWSWWNHYVLNMVSSEFQSLDEIYSLRSNPVNLKQRLLGQFFEFTAKATRDEYMKEMYAHVTVNLSHLASTLIMYCVSQGQREINKQRFFTALYLAIKLLQQNDQMSLHKSLLNPNEYEGLIDGDHKRFDQFILSAERNGLIATYETAYLFLPKLMDEYGFDQIRMENLIAVYSNEAAPIRAVREAVIQALEASIDDVPLKLADRYFDDECRLLAWDKESYSHPKFDDINQHETASDDPSPFLLQPDEANGMGVLLIHGLLASPAEVRGYGEHLMAQGYTVLGIRIKGHGTSPYNLRECVWEDWYASTTRGYGILKEYCNQVFVTGFSTGGALAMLLAAQYPEISGVIAVSIPVKFRDSSLMMVPLLHGTNKLVKWISSYEGVKPFARNEPEHPSVNYRHVPIRALYELRRLIQELQRRLSDIEIPVLIVYADEDPIISIDSANMVMDRLASNEKHLRVVQARQHGILMDNADKTWEKIDEFYRQYQQGEDANSTDGQIVE